jgi:superfamily II DNA/RNA helicase
MGLDCPDVHLILHYGVPFDVETYIQQVIGRAGNRNLYPSVQIPWFHMLRLLPVGEMRCFLILKNAATSAQNLVNA